MYKIRYRTRLGKLWFQDWRTWGETKAEKEFYKTVVVSSTSRQN